MNNTKKLKPLGGSGKHRQTELLWSLGNWQELAKLDTTSSSDPANALYQGYNAIAKLQTGDIDAAKKALECLGALGVKRDQVGNLLLASLHTSLSNARYIEGNKDQASKHLSQSIELTEPEVLRKVVLELRQWQQKKILSSALRSLDSDPEAKSNYKIKKIDQVELGEAWAGNTVNTVIFRHHGLFTRNGMQYGAFYVDQSTLRVFQRNLTTNEIITSDIEGQYNIKDAHNSISLGMDRQQHIHISYDHHGTQLKYRRSLKPNSIEGWSDELPMTGVREAKVTYPSFLMPTETSPLQLLYRDGIDRKGSAYIKQYSEDQQCWVDMDTAVLSGSTNQPWTSNAYWNHPVRDSDGTLHISFVWRTHSIGENQKINNLNICYARSFDDGKSWYSSNMQPFQLPITQVNAEVIWPVSPASNLINQCSMAVDSQNRPHIVFYANDTAGVVQYQHLWFDGVIWRHQLISKRRTAFELCGIGTLRIPISRPEIVIDDNDNVFVIYRGDLTNDRMAVLCLETPAYRYEQSNQKFLSDKPLGLAEPVIDRLRWQKEKVLSMFIQFNDQPNHDIGHTSLVESVSIIDVDFGE